MCLKRNLTLTLDYQQLISNKENQAALNVHVLLEVNSHSTYKQPGLFIERLQSTANDETFSLSPASFRKLASPILGINPGGQFLKEILNEELILLEERRYNW